MRHPLRSHVAAALVLLAPTAALVAEPAAAQARVIAVQPGIRTMALNSDAGLSAGAHLRVQVYATPGARSAHAALGDSGVRIALREQTAGNYVGNYTVRRADRIDPTQPMTVRLQYGSDTVAQTFSYPPAFQALASGAAPAAAAGTPAIERFVMNARAIEPGAVLRFRVVGTPGARAIVRVPDVVRGLRLTETRPGVYVGSYTVRRRDDPAAFERAEAVLRSGEQRVVARVEMGGRDERVANRDNRPPRIFDMVPGNGDRLSDTDRRMRLSARLSDDGSGVDPDSVRLRINGRDVTDRARITAEEVRFRDDLPTGRHTAEVLVKDRAGNASRVSWTFDLV